MENRDIAAVFEEISNLMKIIQDDPKWTFKAAAYDRAKRAIEGLPERLEDIARDPNRKPTSPPPTENFPVALVVTQEAYAYEAASQTATSAPSAEKHSV
jgi:hypothetical protein